MKKTILALLALGAFGVAHATAVDGEPRTAISNTKEAGHTIPYTRADENTATNQLGKTHAKITVTGKVINSTCEINANDRNQTVNLKTVGTNQLKRVGDVAADHLVQIKLENCNKTTAGVAGGPGNNNKVTVAFNATNKIDNFNDGTLKNLEVAPDAAQNVNIQFANLDGSPIRLGINDVNNTLAPTNKVDGDKYVIEFLARYFATGEAKPGKVKGEAELDLAYE